MAQRDIEWWNTPLNQEMQRVDAPKLAKVGVGRYAEERLTDMTAVDVDIQVEPSAWPGVKTTPDNYILTPWKDGVIPEVPVFPRRESGMSHDTVHVLGLWKECLAAERLEGDIPSMFRAQVQSFLNEQRALPDEGDILDDMSAMGAIIANVALTFTTETIPRAQPDELMLQIFMASDLMEDTKLAVTAKALVKLHGANLLHAHPDGGTAIHRAICLKKLETIQTLIGIDNHALEVKDASGFTPLQRALVTNCPEVAKVVMDFLTSYSLQRQLLEEKGLEIFHNMVRQSNSGPTVQVVLDRQIDQVTDEGGDIAFEAHYALLNAPLSYCGVFKSLFDHILSNPDLSHAYHGHRLVRLLLNNKWHAYGDFLMKCTIVLTILSLVPITFVTITAPEALEPRTFSSAVDYIRLVCQALVALRALMLLIREFVRVWRSPNLYRYVSKFDIYRATDILFVVFVVVFIPLHVLDFEAQWILLGLIYFTSAFKIVQLMAASELLGVYMSVITSVMKTVPPKFTVVAAVVLFIFSGTFYPALRAHTTLQDIGNGTYVPVTDHSSRLEFLSYFEVMFFAFRDLVEGRSLVNYYSNSGRIGAFPVIWYLAFLIIAILVLRTMFLAEVVFKFAVVKRDALRTLETNRRKLLPILESKKLLWTYVLPEHWLNLEQCYSERFNSEQLQAILEEDKGDGFVRIEKILERNKRDGEKSQQHLIGLVVGQFQKLESRLESVSQLLEERTGQIMNSLAQSRAESNNDINFVIKNADASHGQLVGTLDQYFSQLGEDRPEFLRRLVEPTSHVAAKVEHLESLVQQMSAKQANLEAITDRIIERMESQSDQTTLQVTCLQKQRDVLGTILSTIVELHSTIDKLKTDVREARSAG
ncbi:uncharacterized protein LOC135817400 [Sycon ciliatum]|uniref:uncharacterized protein LOC135817400 n=1 Tax=Sycon ciliatum TaxID=27933 RepID=UPI0031F6B57B